MDSSISRAPASRHPVFEDGLGKRYNAVGPAGEPLEVLAPREELTAVSSFEFSLRERVAALAAFQHPSFVRVLGVQRLTHDTSSLAVVSDRVSGARLSDVLAVADQQLLPLEINAALFLIRQLTQAVAALHEQMHGVAHGAIAPERIVITPSGRLVIVEHVLGTAIEQLHLSHELAWTELGIPLPITIGAPRFDQRADILQVGAVALALIVGRPLYKEEYPDKIAALAERAWGLTATGGVEPLSAAVRAWVARALQLDIRQSFDSAVDAWVALDRVLGGADQVGPVATLRSFVAEYAKHAAPQGAAADAPTTMRVAITAPAAAPAAMPHAAPVTSASKSTATPTPKSTPRPAPALSQPLPPPRAAAAAVSAPRSTPLPIPPPPVPLATPALWSTEPLSTPGPRSTPLSTPTPRSAPLSTPAPRSTPPPAATPAPWSSTMPAPAPRSTAVPTPTPRSTPRPSPASAPTPRPIMAPMADEAAGLIRGSSQPPGGAAIPVVPLAAANDPPAPAARPSMAGSTPSASSYGSAPRPASMSAPASPVATPAPVAPALPRSMAYILTEPGPEPEMTDSRPWWRRRWVAAAVVLAALAGGSVLAGRWYIMPPAAAEAAGTLIVDTNPGGAAVVIDGKPRGFTPLTLSLSPGTHSLEVRSEGESRAIPLTITAGATMSQFIELPQPGAAAGQLQVQTEPSGARVTVDGVTRGVAPVVVEALPPGTHGVVVANDAASAASQLTAEPGATASLVAPIVTPTPAAASGWISVIAPADVQIYENDRLLGSSRSDRLMLPPGRHRLQLVNEPLGYRATRVVNVAAGQVAQVRLEWPNGSMALNAQPWAEVWIGSDRLGETPIGNVPVPIGTHDVVFRHPELGEQIVRATVTLTAPTRLSVDLRQR